MKKSILSFVVMIVMLCSMSIGTFALADESEIQPLYDYTVHYDVNLIASGSTLTGTAYLQALQGTTTKVNVVMTLQKKGLLFWSDASNDFNYTMYSYYADTDNTYTVSSGTYRLKVVFTVYSGTDYETITAYSQNVTV